MSLPTTASAPQPNTPAPAQVSPWQRWGWLMWAVWMIFLILPAVAVWRDDRSPFWRIGGLVLILVFAVSYSVAAWQILEKGRGGTRAAVATLGFLVALTIVAIPFLGSDAVAFTPFVVSFAGFTLPRPWHWLFGLAVFAVCVGALSATLPLSEWSYFIFILVAVTIGVNAARLLSEQSEGYARVRRRLDITEERERVARDVHDVLGHSLTVVSVKAGLAERLIDVDPDRARAEVADIARIARESLAEIRATVGGLRATHLAAELAAAREGLLSAGIAAELPPDPEVVDPSHRAVLAWVLRESVTNVVRHSRATTCRIELAAHTLVVEDDGVGLGDRRMGNGLRGLRERVVQAGGDFSVGARADGQGTRLEVSWPG
ncbi:sensor histidine kinase [Nostocoides sp. F2B08]|uniref:sensor histidine kinase n=1 Tax=Nostocoides sp. F2B08 TaxID=2653936 RepID=UPI00186AF47C|nr:sensor histidine kinase [Tetrasphaera sp. F2B08]